MNDLKILPLCLCFVALFGCSPYPWRPLPPEQLSDLRDRYIEFYNSHADCVAEHLDYAWVDGHAGVAKAADCLELSRMRDAYYTAVVDGPRGRGQLRFVIQDDAGQQVQNVEVEVLYASGNGWAEPTVQHKNIIVNGETCIPVSPFANLELKTYKKGFRPEYFTLLPGPGSDRFGRAESMLEKGCVLPPESPDGPVRIVMPHWMDWGVPIAPWKWDNPESEWYWVHRDLWPAKIPDRCPVLISSERPGRRLVTTRGTYALVGASKKPLTLLRLDTGNLLEIGKPFYGYLNGTQQWIIPTMCKGSGDQFPAADGPYEWRLFAVAKPRAPTTQAAEKSD